MTIPVQCFRQAFLDQFKSNLQSNLSSYETNEIWVHAYFGDSPWSSDTSLSLPAGFELLSPTSRSNLHDLENTIRLHTALQHLTVAQATDERLWAWLAHVQFWQYMRARWPVERYVREGVLPSKVANNIKERYFFMSNRHRALVRHGIARLWWYGHISYDASREDPYELTALLLSKLDIAQSLLERNVSGNLAVCKAVLHVLEAEEKKGNDFSDRERFRDLVQHLNRLGGVTVLDALEEEEIRSELEARLLQTS